MKEDAQFFYPVQLKELPPDDLNPEISMDDLYDKLDKYSGTDDLSVAIRVSRAGTLRWEPWPRPKRPTIRELWYFGCTSADQLTWFICGDILQRPVFHEFTYPTGVPAMSNHTI